MNFNNFPYSLSKSFFPAIITSLVLISCQNCNTINAENKIISSADSIKIKERNRNKIFDIDKKDTISKTYLLGKINPSKDSNFNAVDLKYTSKKNMYLKKEAYAAFIEMFDAAKKDGIKLTIISSTRTFSAQKRIWEGKWTGKVLYYGKNIATTYPNKIDRSKYVLKYSSMPGTSRHHWGTEIDLNSIELSYYKTKTGEKTYYWLTKNASKYGFCQPYTAKDTIRTTGYEEEKWHWSYVPLSKEYLKQYKERITYDDLKGFEGSETAVTIDVIKNYVLSVNENCK